MRLLLPALAAALVLAGCAAAPAAPSVGPEPGSPVYTDWSQLTPYEAPREPPLYRRFEPYSGEALTARDDYGPLLPYVGADIQVPHSIDGRLPLYGLATCDGRLVTDPVYARVERAGIFRHGTPRYGPFLLLRKGQVWGHEDTEWGRAAQGAFSLTVAAPNGGWVREFGVARAELVNPERLCVQGQDGSVTLLDAAGRDAALFSGETLRAHLGEDFSWHVDDPYNDMGPWLAWFGEIGRITIPKWDREDPVEHYLYLNAADGSVSAEPPPGYSEEPPEDAGRAEDFSLPGYGYLEPIADPFTGAVYYLGSRADESGRQDLLDGEGAVVLADCGYPNAYFYAPQVWNGLASCIRDGAFCRYDPEGNCVLRYPLHTNSA